MVDRDPATVRKWVQRGYLRPAVTLTEGRLVRHKFREADVWTVARERMPQTVMRGLKAASAAFLAESA